MTVSVSINAACACVARGEALMRATGFSTSSPLPTTFMIPGTLPGTIEKFGYVATTVALYALGRIAWVDAQAAVPDGLLGVLFVVAFLKTRDV